MSGLLFTVIDNERWMYLPTWSVISCVAWSSLYGILCRVNSLRSHEWNCRIVTAVHGLLSFAVASWSAFITGPFPLRHDAVGGKNSFLQEVVMIICLGYFVFDFLWCLVMQTEGLLMLIHHLTCIAGLVVTLSWGVSGAELSATVVGGEITNPFLQARWFLRETSMNHGRLSNFVDFMFVFLYLTCRIGVGAALFYVSIFSPNVAPLIKLGGITLYTISLVFMGQILRFAYRKLSKGRRRAPDAAAAATGKPANGGVNASLNGAKINGHNDTNNFANGHLRNRAS